MILTNMTNTTISGFLPVPDKSRHQKESTENSFTQIIQENGIVIDKEAACSPNMNQPDFVKNMCYTTEDFFRTFAPKTHYQGKWCSMAELIDLWKNGCLKLTFTDEDLREDDLPH